MASQADDPQSQSAVGEQPRAQESLDTPVVDEADDVTVVGTADALEAEEFPQGLSPRELALTLKGQLLGHFHLQEFIGGGGMGAVFKALDTTLDRIVAVKVVASQQISTEDLQRRFLIEAQSTARLDHPNIARIHYVGRDRGLPYIVFEYIEGANLRDLVANHGPIPLGDALSITCQIAHALAHAWQKEVVHRDIKPSNILVTREGQAKLVDMGLARLHQVDTVDDDLTNTGMTLGTFDYISPEQARDPREADTRSDIYSLGCTLFYMLVGRPPFASGTAVQKLLKHQDQTPPNLAEILPDLPGSAATLVNSMLAKSPELRPQTPTELVMQCYEIFQELGIQPPSSLAPLQIAAARPLSPPWRTHLPWIVPICLLLLIAIAWESATRNSAATIDFDPIRLPETTIGAEPVEATAGIGEDDQPTGSETEVEAETATQQRPSAAEPVDSQPQSEDEWDFSPLLLGQPAESSLLDFPAGEPVADENAFEPAEESLDLEDVIKLDR